MDYILEIAEMMSVLVKPTPSANGALGNCAKGRETWDSFPLSLPGVKVDAFLLPHERTVPCASKCPPVQACPRTPCPTVETGRRRSAMRSGPDSSAIVRLHAAGGGAAHHGGQAVLRGRAHQLRTAEFLQQLLHGLGPDALDGM